MPLLIERELVQGVANLAQEFQANAKVLDGQNDFGWLTATVLDHCLHTVLQERYYACSLVRLAFKQSVSKQSLMEKIRQVTGATLDGTATPKPTRSHNSFLQEFPT